MSFTPPLSKRHFPPAWNTILRPFAYVCVHKTTKSGTKLQKKIDSRKRNVKKNENYLIFAE